VHDVGYFSTPSYYLIFLNGSGTAGKISGNRAGGISEEVDLCGLKSQLTWIVTVSPGAWRIGETHHYVALTLTPYDKPVWLYRHFRGISGKGFITGRVVMACTLLQGLAVMIRPCSSDV
jgi:hypothetical protein